MLDRILELILVDALDTDAGRHQRIDDDSILVALLSASASGA
jgi:hypothetical protein